MNCLLIERLTSEKYYPKWYTNSNVIKLSSVLYLLNVEVHTYYNCTCIQTKRQKAYISIIKNEHIYQSTSVDTSAMMDFDV